MPVTRQGRFMYASREELSGYLGREAGLDVPVHIATENMDLSADLKLALAHARAGKHDKKTKAKRLERASGFFRSIIAVIVSRSSSPEVLSCGFSFPGSQSFSCGDC